MLPIKRQRLSRRTHASFGRHTVTPSSIVLTCVLCGGDPADDQTCDPYELKTHGKIAAMQQHLRRSHLGPDFAGDDHYYDFFKILGGPSLHLWNGVRLFHLADNRPWLFAGMPGQYQLWLDWRAAGSPPLSPDCTEDRHRICKGANLQHTRCGCMACKHPESLAAEPASAATPSAEEDLDLDLFD